MFSGLGILNKNSIASTSGVESVSSRVGQIENALSSLTGRQNTPNVQFNNIMQSISPVSASQRPEQTVTLLSPEVLINLIKTNASKYGVDPKLVNAVIKNESNYNVKAVSKCGAVGLMQVMPATGKAMGYTNLEDPVQNVEAGTKYLAYLLDKFNNNTVLAVAAYNAGPGNVSKYGGTPPFKETQNYVRNVLSTYLDSHNKA